MADLFDLDSDPFGVGTRRRPGSPSITGAAVPRTSTSALSAPGTGPTATAGPNLSTPNTSQFPQLPLPTPMPAPSNTPDYTTLGAFANRLQGYDMSKFARPYSDWSEKYKIGAVQSHFDPLQGVNPAYLAALNSLGIADFYGEGDQLGVRNTRNDPRFGGGGLGDVVYGLRGQNAATAWQPWTDPSLSSAAPGGDGSDLASLLASLTQRTGPNYWQPFQGQEQPFQGQDLSGFAQLIASLSQPQPQAAPINVTLPTPQVQSRTPQRPTFQGDYVRTPLTAQGSQPGGDVGRAMQVLASQLGQPQGRPAATPSTVDPRLLQALMQLLGQMGGRA